MKRETIEKILQAIAIVLCLVILILFACSGSDSGNTKLVYGGF